MFSMKSIIFSGNIIIFSVKSPVSPSPFPKLEANPLKMGLPAPLNISVEFFQY